MPCMIIAQNISGRFSSSLYSFERADAAGEMTNNIRSFQTLQLSLSKSNFALRTRMNLEANLTNKLKDDPRLRFYNLYLEGRDLFGLATLKIGRIPVFSSAAGGVYDGADLKLKYADFRVNAFYGGIVPAYQKLEINSDFANNYFMSGEVKYVGLENFTFSAGYADKNVKPESYLTTRLDENYDPVTVLIQKASSQYKYLTGGIAYVKDGFADIYTNYEFDLNFVTTSKFEVAGRYSQIENLGIDIYYGYREPRVRYNSIFSVFDFGNTSEIEVGADYQVVPGITVIGKYGSVQYKDDNSGRITAGLSTEYGTFNYRKTLGYSGELDAVSVGTARSFMDGFITPSLAVSYTTYKLSADSEENSLVSLLGGVNVRPWRFLSFDLQGQYISNKIYKNDFRVFFKLNHWFSTNLGLL